MMVQNGDRTGWGRNWLLVIGAALVFWLVVGAIDTLWFYLVVSAKGKVVDWRQAAAANWPYWVTATVLTPAVVWLTRRIGFSFARSWRIILVHIIGAMVFAVAHVALYRAVRNLQVGKPVWTADFTWQVQKYVAGVLDKEMLVYLVIVGAVFIHDYYRRYREKERAAADLELEQARLRALLSQAQLEALKMQLQPHFLFNALHAISTLIMRGDAEAANQMLLRLSQFLRMTLDSTDAPVVPLSVELEFLDAYLKIQKERFGDRLRVEMHVEPVTLEAQVPNLILQPLVENSIRHGIGADPGAGVIEIRTRVEDGVLEIEVRDNGAGLRESGEPQQGVGLANIRARLEQLYPGAHTLALGAVPTGTGTVATISIPFRLLREESS